MSRFLVLLAMTTVALSGGCGGSETKLAPVKGRLVAKDDSPFKVQRPDNQPLPPGDPGIRVKFVRVGDPPPGEDTTYYASVNAETSAFEVPGKANRGIPPGKYQVIIAVGAAGEPVGRKGPSRGGPPGAGAPSMDGVEVAWQEVTVPDEGLTDLKLTVEVKK